MNLRRGIAALLLALAATAAAPAPASASAARDRIAIEVDRTTVDTRLGRKFVVRTTISNRAPSPTGPLVAHLNVLSLRTGVYVDPEDWSSRRTQFFTLSARESQTLTWNLQAVNAGSFGAYVTVLRPDAAGRRPITSRAVQIAVAERKTINSSGILPLAIGIPALIGLLAAGTRVLRRRR